MGLFDFFKPNKPKLSQAERMFVRLAYLIGPTAKQVSNLQAVGRFDDAKIEANKFIDEIAAAHSLNVENDGLLRLAARFARNVGVTSKARTLLETALKNPKITSLFDPTVLLCHLGHMYYMDGLNIEKSLECFEQAVAAAAPSGCKEPADKVVKAYAHFWAAIMARKLGDHQSAELHDQRRRVLCPNLDLDDPQILLALQRDYI